MCVCDACVWQGSGGRAEKELVDRDKTDIKTNKRGERYESAELEVGHTVDGVCLCV